MKPDEAAFLKQYPPKLDDKASGHESSCNASNNKDEVREINENLLRGGYRPSSSATESLHGISPRTTESSCSAESSAYAPFHQHQISSMESGKSDSSLSSSESTTLAPSDHKRKFGALSEDDLKISPSVVAVDIFHPSEIKVHDGDLGSPGTTFWRDHSIQVLITLTL